MKRRDFLKNSSLLLTSMGLPLVSLDQILAQTSQDWFFVQISVTGGWDITLATDPWLSQRPDEKEMFIEYNPADISRFANIAFGPSLLPLQPYASQMCLVNGVFLSASDNGHDAALRYMQTGSTKSNWGTLGVEILQTRDSENLGLVANSSVHLGTRSQLVTQASSLQQLQSQASIPFQSSQNSNNRLSQLQSELIQAKSKIDNFKEIIKKIQSSGVSNLTDNHYLAASLAARLSRAAAITLSNNLDTHDNHVGQHQENLKTNFQKVAEIFSIFKSIEIDNSGESLLDRTTFVITSEFSRTAALNNSGGKDHNPLTNSVVLLGPKIKGGQVLGGSRLVKSQDSKIGSSYHIAAPIDGQTGELISNSDELNNRQSLLIRPENIAATVIESLGISRKRFASVDFKTPSLSKWILR